MLCISGIIPASAGNTCPDRPILASCRDHPRIRGEHIFEGLNREDLKGSSPHPRGTQKKFCHLFCFVRIIPASAGNTATKCFGEGRRRIIPASAGNTIRMSSKARSTRDHPRIRGEHYDSLTASGQTEGSSPHPRGTHLKEIMSSVDAGIIPASAGNTLSNEEIQSFFGDHPRIRGEHKVTPVRSGRRTGSSPHPRGTLIDTFRLWREKGIIPASAGNTLLHLRRTDGCWDHPRIRGEHVVAPQ